MMVKLLSAAALCIAACATKAPPVAAQMDLEKEASTALARMQERDPGISQVIGSAAGYAVFPDVGAGAVVAGGAFGRGVFFEHGAPIGYVELKQGSIGLQLGGHTYSELLVLRERDDVERLKANAFTIGADASAVALDAGAQAKTHFDEGTNIFVMTRGGLMAGVSVTGQKIEYRPLG
jgi:lipid-binding SYLF domain-containing protein